MFGGPPEGYEPSPVELDLRERWQVDAATRGIAMAMIEAAAGAYPLAGPGRRDPDGFAVYVGLALPGKEYGIWEIGQPVELAPGFFLALDAYDGARQARDLAEHAAAVHLAGRGGTASYARLTRGEHCAVWESYPVDAAGASA